MQNDYYIAGTMHDIAKKDGEKKYGSLSQQT